MTNPYIYAGLYTPMQRRVVMGVRRQSTDSHGPDAAEIIRFEVCEWCGITISEVEGPRRSRDIIKARHLSMYFIRNLTKLSLKKIGQMFGNRDHSSVIYGWTSVCDQKDINAAYRDELAKLEIVVCAAIEPI